MMIIAAIVLGAINASAEPTKVAQKDTVVISSTVKFDKETFVSDKGNYKESYQVQVDGKWYYTTKTSYERYYTILRYGGTPTVAFVKENDKIKRVIVL